MASQLGAKRPQLDSILAPFSKESVYVGLARVARDTSRYPAWFRLMAVHEDTLMVPVDSVKARKDTLAVEEPEDEEDAELENPSVIQVTRSRVPVRVIQKEQPELEEIVKEEKEAE